MRPEALRSGRIDPALVGYTSSPFAVERYIARVRGPIWDYLDIRLRLAPVLLRS